MSISPPRASPDSHGVQAWVVALRYEECLQTLRFAKQANLTILIAVLPSALDSLQDLRAQRARTSLTPPAWGGSGGRGGGG